MIRDDSVTYTDFNILFLNHRNCNENITLKIKKKY